LPRTQPGRSTTSSQTRTWPGSPPHTSLFSAAAGACCGSATAPPAPAGSGGAAVRRCGGYGGLRVAGTRWAGWHEWRRRPGDRGDVVHVLDPGRHRRRGGLLRGDQGGPRQDPRVHPLLWVVALLFVVYFLRGPIEQLILK